MTAFGAEPLPEVLGSDEEASDRKVVALKFPSWVPGGIPWQELRGAVEGVFSSTVGNAGSALHELVSGLPFWSARSDNVGAGFFDNDDEDAHPDPISYDICGGSD